MRIAILRLWCAGGVVLGGECKPPSHLVHGAAADGFISLTLLFAVTVF